MGPVVGGGVSSGERGGVTNWGKEGKRMEVKSQKCVVEGESTD